MAAPIRRITSLASVIVTLLLQWGTFEYSSASNLPPNGNTITGVQVITQQILIKPGFVPGWTCLVWLVLAGLWVVWRERQRKANTERAITSVALFKPGSNMQVRMDRARVGRGQGWDVALFGVWTYGAAVWAQVLISALTIKSYPPLELWYHDLLIGFWLFPVGLGSAIAIRFLPLPANS